MKSLFALLLLCISLTVQAQFTRTETVYVAAKSGLSIREKPDAKATVLGKIPYGTKITTTYNSEEEQKDIVTEGLQGYWIKTSWNGKTGYVVNSYLLPVAVPKAGTKTMKDYFKQLSAVAGPVLTVKKGEGSNIGENYSEIKKQLFKNGFEYHEAGFYEASYDTYFLPGLSVQQGFLLLRLIPEFKDVFSETDEYPSENKTRKPKADGEDAGTIKVIKPDGGNWTEKIIVDYSDGAYYHFELFELNGQLVISFGGGV